jgi:predicted O-methyltransferase YrrM
MSEIKKKPKLTYDEEGNKIYTFHHEHTFADIARWIIAEGGREGVIQMLKDNIE